MAIDKKSSQAVKNGGEPEMLYLVTEAEFKALGGEEAAPEPAPSEWVELVSREEFKALGAPAQTKGKKPSAASSRKSLERVNDVPEGGSDDEKTDDDAVRIADEALSKPRRRRGRGQ